MRTCGVLLPIFSLSSDYGIGCFSKEAYDFVDFLKSAGQNYWQILPMGPTSYGDSPYQSFSTFAGNPYFIDVNEFIDAEIVEKTECDAFSCGAGEKADYEKLYEKRMGLLRLIFERMNLKDSEEYVKFCEENAFWLDDYALFMAIKDSFNGVSWDNWDDGIRMRRPEALEAYSKKCEKEADFYRFTQFYFFKQWFALKEYAGNHGVKIIGDIPIYVAYDSSDVWANPELFDLDGDYVPKAVAGCPPDAFSATGQLWGNPLYDWAKHRESDYSWWVSRMRICFKLYDVVRIDHFRGFDAFYAIPYGDKTAEFGEWRQGPGYELFAVFKKELGDIDVIAEDLGFLTDSVRELVKKTGYPGMKVLEFAFGGDAGNEYLPHNLSKNSVIYTGTHDNETLKGWYKRCLKEDKHVAKHIDDYFGGVTVENIDEVFIRAAYSSVCDTCIIPLWDWLGLGNEARINVPSVLGGNWVWRMKRGALTKALAEKMRKYKELYAR